MSIAEDVERLERRMDALKVEYEHYFSGRARTEPAKLREEVQGIIARWSGRPISNTMFKFRYRSLVSRYNTLSAYWSRTLQAIEDGTFKRDQFRMRDPGSRTQRTGREAPAPRPYPLEARRRRLAARHPLPGVSDGPEGVRPGR